MSEAEVCDSVTSPLSRNAIIISSAVAMTALSLGDKIIYETFPVVNYQRPFRVPLEFTQRDEVF